MKTRPKTTAMTSACGDQRVGIRAAAGAQRAGDRRRDAAAHRAGRHHLHQHQHREDQRHAGQRVGAELADEVGLDQADGGLDHHHQHVGRREAQQGRRRSALRGACGCAGRAFDIGVCVRTYYRRICAFVHRPVWRWAFWVSRRICPQAGLALGFLRPLGRICPQAGLALGFLCPLGRTFSLRLCQLAAQ